MTRTANLKPVIVPVDRRHGPTAGADEVVLEVNRRSREIRAVGGLRRPWLSGSDCFLVTKGADGRGFARGHLSPVWVRDATGRSLGIVLDYKVWCEAGDQQKLVGQLYALDVRPEAVFQRRFAAWIEDQIKGVAGGPAVFIDTFLDVQRSRLQEALGAWADGLGLRCQGTIRAQHESELRRVEIRGYRFRLPVRDNPSKYLVELDAGVAIDSERRLDAIVDFKDAKAIRLELTKALARYAREHLTLQGLHDHDNELASPPLKRAADEHLEAFARRVETLSLRKLEPVVDVDLPDEISHLFDGKLRDLDRNVGVKTRMQLRLDDVAKYRTECGIGVEAWAKDAIESATSSVFFGVTFRDLCTDYDGVKQKILEEFEGRAATVGCGVESLITFICPELRKLMDGFTVDDETGKLYRTSVSTGEAGVAFSLRARIVEPPEEVVQILNSGRSIEDAVRETTRQAISEVIAKLPPEAVQVRFDVGEGRQQAVKDKLERHVRKRLRRVFNAAVETPGFKPLPTAWSDAFGELVGQVREFRLTVNPPGEQPVSFRGAYQVDGMQEGGWLAFCKRPPDMDRLDKLVKDRLADSLQNVAPEELKGTLNRDLQRDVGCWIAEEVGRRTGLQIQLESWRREPTRDEEARADLKGQEVDAWKGVQEERIRSLAAQGAAPARIVAAKLEQDVQEVEIRGEQLLRGVEAGLLPESEIDELRSARDRQVERAATAARESVTGRDDYPLLVGNEDRVGGRTALPARAVASLDEALAPHPSRTRQPEDAPEGGAPGADEADLRPSASSEEPRPASEGPVTREEAAEDSSNADAEPGTPSDGTETVTLNADDLGESTQ